MSVDLRFLLNGSSCTDNAMAVTTVLMNNYLLQPEAYNTCAAYDVWKRLWRQWPQGNYIYTPPLRLWLLGVSLCACVYVCVLRVLYVSVRVLGTPARGRTIIKRETSHPAYTHEGRRVYRTMATVKSWDHKLDCKTADDRERERNRQRDARSRQRVK